MGPNAYLNEDKYRCGARARVFALLIYTYRYCRLCGKICAPNAFTQTVTLSATPRQNHPPSQTLPHTILYIGYSRIAEVRFEAPADIQLQCIHSHIQHECDMLGIRERLSVCMCVYYTKIKWNTFWKFYRCDKIHTTRLVFSWAKWDSHREYSNSKVYN